MSEQKRKRGRPKGSLNTATADVRILAQKYGLDAIKRLAHLLEHAESEQAQIAAAKELLDRGFGRSVQALGVSDHNGNVVPVGIDGLAALSSAGIRVAESAEEDA